MHSSRAALLLRTPDDLIARLAKPSPLLGEGVTSLSAGQFLQTAEALAAKLPEGRYALNLCDNRLHFLLSFCATLIRGQTNLLPANRALSTQQQLLERSPDTYILHDGLQELAPAECFDLGQCALGEFTATAATEVPHISLDQEAAIVFTSGSTGESQPNPKTWRTYVESAAINAHYYLPEFDSLYHAVATVPSQHMWGLETTILLPLFNRVCVLDSRPLFPKDVAVALESLPAPRLLISTPVHLRALNNSGLEFSEVARVLCATAPLSPELAAQIEQCFNGSVQEIFGCSEVGSMAARATASTEAWTLFSGLNFAAANSADGYAEIVAAHLPHPVPLQDKIETSDGRQFILLGRGDDMLEIAGKRGSLLQMNTLLMAYTGLKDGIIFVPENNDGVNRLSALVVFNSEGSKEGLKDHLQRHIDPVFLPRPIVAVEALPRAESGKLPRRVLLDFYRQQLGVS